MAGEAALVLKMEARLRDFERQMDKAAKAGDRAAKQIEDRFSKINPKSNLARFRSDVSGLLPIVGRLGLAVAGVFSGAKLVEAADTFTRVQNALKVTGLEGDRLKAVYSELYATAQRQGAPLETLATLYSRISGAQAELNTTSTELLQFTEGVATALRVSGQSAEQASGALLQLGQALAGGKVQAEEYNSLLDGARPLLQAVANGLEEAGGSVAKLTALVKDGQVSSEAFYRAGLAGFPALAREASSSSTTVSQATQRVGNAFVALVGQINEVGDVSGNTTQILIGLANVLDRITSTIPGYLAKLREAQDPKFTVKGGFAGDITDERQWAAVLGVPQVEQAGQDLETALKRVAEARRKAIEGGVDEAARGRALSALPPRIQQVSLADFPVTGGAGRSRGGGGGGGGSRAASPDEFARELQQYQQRRAALELEAQTLGMSTLEVEKAKAIFDLMNAAKQAGIPISDSLRQQIEAEGLAYGEVSQKLESMRAAQEQINEFSEQIGSALSNAFTDAIVNGEKLDVVLQNLLKQLASMAINSAFQQLFSANGSGGSVFGNFLSGLLGFGGARAGGGPVSAGRSYLVGERGPELFTPGRSGMITPNSTLARGGGVGGQGGVVIQQSNTFSGGMSAADRVQMARAIKEASIQGVREAMARGKI